MNEWATIKAIFSKKLKTAMFQFLITMVATVVFDLTKAILIGVAFSLILFVIKVSDMQVTVAEVDPDKLDEENVDPKKLEYTSVVYITGPLYFGTCAKLEDKVSSLGDSYNIIFSMRGVTVADISGIQALHEYCERLIAQGRMVYFSCVQPPVMDLFERTGLKEERFKHNMFFWSTDKVFEHISSL
jgi:SulP family sulfate permease